MHDVAEAPDFVGFCEGEVDQDEAHQQDGLGFKQVVAKKRDDHPGQEGQHHQQVMDGFIERFLTAGGQGIVKVCRKAFQVACGEEVRVGVAVDFIKRNPLDRGCEGDDNGHHSRVYLKGWQADQEEYQGFVVQHGKAPVVDFLFLEKADEKLGQEDAQKEKQCGEHLFADAQPLAVKGLDGGQDDVAGLGGGECAEAYVGVAVHGASDKGEEEADGAVFMK